MNRKLSPFSSYRAQVAGALLLFVCLILIVWFLPVVQVSSLPNSAGRIEAEIAARDVLVKAIGGLLVFVTAFVSVQNLRVSEEKQITERFSKAVEMLGHEGSIHIRLGGIYALERIARDSEKDRYPVMQVLAAFVRVKASEIVGRETSLEENNSHNYEEFSDSRDFAEREHEERYGPGYDEPDPEYYEYYLGTLNENHISNYLIDVQAAISAIGKRDFKDSDLFSLDLSQTRLDGITFRGNYKNINFHRTRFRDCIFGSDINTGGANFLQSNFREAVFEKAEFKYADFREVRFDSSIFLTSTFEGTDFRSSYLLGAKFSGRTNINKCHFESADLTRVSVGGEIKLLKPDKKKRMRTCFKEESEVKGTFFRDANFTEAHLSDVLFEEGGYQKTKFVGAVLRGVTFRSIDLSSTNFSRSRIGIEYDEYTAQEHFRDDRSDGVSFIDTGLAQADLEKAKATLKDVSFE